jgi:hypothetical protein
MARSLIEVTLEAEKPGRYTKLPWCAPHLNFHTLRFGLIIFGIVLAWTADAAAQDKDWNIFTPPWDQAKQMVCTEVRRDVCRLRESCGPSNGQAKLTFDFVSNRIDFGGLDLRGKIPEIRITGRTFYTLSKIDPTMALLVGDGRLFKLQYRLNDPDHGKVTMDSNGQLVVRRSKDDVRVIEPRAQLIGFMVGYQRWDLIKKEDEIEVMRFECSKLDFLKR